jgi:inorganic phosphate transporter, PiT family
VAIRNQKRENRYVNDLRRFGFVQSQYFSVRRVIVPLGLSIVFLALVGLFVSGSQDTFGADWVYVAIAAVIGGYMALNIGANDVANNMGPAVGGKVLTVGAAILIAVICESAGAILAGGEVVKTVSKGVITPGDSISPGEFRDLMLSALLAAALWINLATILSAPVSTTHSIIGGVLGAGIATAGLGLVHWGTVSAIIASWVISPIFGAACAALILLFIKTRILFAEDRLAAARRWVPILMATMASAFTAYMALKGLKKVWTPGSFEIIAWSALAFAVSYGLARPYIARRVRVLTNSRSDIYKLFHVPLIAGVALLSFAHGANDVANAVGPLAAIVSTFGNGNQIASQVSIPLWVMMVGAFGIALGLGLFGPRLISVVGQKITRLNASRAFCVALSAALTVLIATTLGLPVSSTHIAVGAVFGVGFLREFLENPNKRKLRPGHKLNATADEAFNSLNFKSVRRLVRRRFAVSIAAAWFITVPASALLAAAVYRILRLL